MPVSGKLTPADGSEQSVATNGHGLVLYTSNYQDGFSTNGGRSFFPLDPSAVFPSADGGFCCDQVVIYVPSVDRFVWVLQYWAGSAGAQDRSKPNRIRVATATSAQFESCRALCWHYYDWTASELGARPPAAGKTLALDRPYVAFTDGMLSLTAAFVYNPDHLIFGSAIWRFPLAQLGGTVYPRVVPVQFTSTDQIAGDVRLVPAQNAIFDNGSTQYFANRETTSRLGFVRWRDRDPSPVFYEVDVPSIATENNDGPTDAAPSGSDWSGRYTANDGQLVTGAQRHGVAWFGWTAGRDADTPDGGLVHVHDQPAAEFAGISTATLQAVDYESIEFVDAATVNPQLSFNGEGILGVDFMFGGPKINPSFAVAFLRPNWDSRTAVVGGASDPGGLGNSGDFNGLAPDPVQLNCFVAAGSAIKLNPGTSTTPASLYHDPHYVVFGQKSHCTVPRTVPTHLILSGVDQVGNLLAVSGTMSPPVSGRVTVEYTPPDGKSISHVVTTETNGHFSDSLVIPSDEAGQWTVRARWFGQGYYIGAGSHATVVNVAPTSPADLVVDRVYGNPNDICTIYADIHNIGNTPAPATQTEFKDLADPPTFDQLVPTPALDPGQTVTVSLARSYSQNDGALVTADATGVVNTSTNTNTGYAYLSTNGNCHYP